MSIVIANWKMNTPEGGVKEWFDQFKKEIGSEDGQRFKFERIVAICPSYMDIKDVNAEVLKYDLEQGWTKKLDEGCVGSGYVNVGAQNVSTETKGAFTGEVSIKMLELFVQYVLVGHSERRTLFGEKDTDVHAKIKRCLEGGFLNIKPVLCVGETLEQRKQGKTKSVVKRQLKKALDGLGESGDRVIVAYEPVWAIGTGLVPTMNEIAEVIQLINQEVNKGLGKMQILYGGSVSESNAAEIMRIDGLGGLLVGGASLDGKKFAQLVRAAQK